MLRRRVYISPGFQLSKLLSSPIRNQRVITPRTRFIRYWVPIIRSVVIPVRSRSDLLRDIKHGRDGGCEYEAFENGIFPGSLEDGKRSGDGGIDQGFGEG